MRREQLRAFWAWFGNYVKDFYDDKEVSHPGFRIKEAHTMRVCANIAGIGSSLGLGEEDLLIAETVALFHDVGRFRQYAIHRTFNDRKSENHSLLGLRELERAGVLSSLEDEEQNIITTAIRCHNMISLPGGLQGRPLLFARMIRDADKLDILEVFAGHYLSPDSDLIQVTGPPDDSAGYSPVLAENLLQGKMCSYEDVKNGSDRKLLMLSWLYDINFDFTIREIASRGLITKILDSLPGNGEKSKMRDHLHNYLKSRLETAGD